MTTAKPFDISAFDTLTASQAGTPMPLLNLRTGAAYLRADGSPVTITLLGRASDVYRAQQRTLQERRADRNARGITLTPDDSAQEDGQLLAACTVAWTIDEMDGQQFPFSADNARLLWTDPRFIALRDRGVRWILDDGNFMPTSSPVS